MHEEDKARYFKLVEMARAQVKEARARAAGIVMAGAIPKLKD
jgi:hypothetical protein